MNPLEEMSSSLNLTDAQKAKVQPIVDQAKPQLQTIHQEAMTKAKAVIDASITQIRPLLTPEQQTKLDAIQGARRHAQRNERIARSQGEITAYIAARGERRSQGRRFSFLFTQ
jgi:Spy/CpxP family protein refolding chaperone